MTKYLAPFGVITKKITVTSVSWQRNKKELVTIFLIS